jgi:putative transposase
VAGPNRKYAALINARNKWTGHLWQGRYGSVVMDEAHLYNAFAYISLNPVRAGLVKRAQDWKWSSVRAHLTGRLDGVTKITPALLCIKDFAGMLGGEYDLRKFDALRMAEVTGCPVGDNNFIESLEERFDHILKPQKRGPKQKKQR